MRALIASAFQPALGVSDRIDFEKTPEATAPQGKNDTSWRLQINLMGYPKGSQARISPFNWEAH
jgi:hypothetical protein